MPQNSSRKRRTREHIIADLSVNRVEKCVLQCGWTVQRIGQDYGIDLLMTTFSRRGEIENGQVRLQLKATDSVRIASRRQAIAVRLDWRDVVYWLNEWLPVILVVYDAKKDRACWLYVQQNLREQSPKNSAQRVGDRDRVCPAGELAQPRRHPAVRPIPRRCPRGRLRYPP